MPGGIQTFLSPYNPADPNNPPDQSRVEITYPTTNTFRATSTIGYDVTDPPGTTGFLQQSIAVGLQPISGFTATVGDSGWNAEIPYQAFFAMDFTPKSVKPQITFAKTIVGSTQVAPLKPVTYEYTLTSGSGAFDGSSVVINDDNATPVFKLDDFGYDAKSTSANQVIKPVLQSSTSMYNVGDLNSNGLIDAGEAWKYRATVIPPLPMQVEASGVPKQDSGLITWTTLANGDVRVFYRQNQAFNDNTYGTGSDSGWTKQGKTHKFSDLTGSDKAGFVVYYADGSEMARFFQDYISASSQPASVIPSGYESLGFSGGDGAWVSGTTQSAFTDFDSTLELNLNRSGGYTLNTASGGYTPYTKMILNTPTAAAALPTGGVVDPNWDQIDGYYFTIKQSSLAAKGFGGAFIFDQHNSPAKIGGSNSYIPTVKQGDSVNTATFAVKSLADNQIYTDTDQATVTIGSVTPPPPSQLPKFFVADDKSPDATFTYSATGSSIGSWLLKDKYNKYPRDIASNADSSKLWVVDKNKSVNLYGLDANGKYVWQSAWTAYSLGGEPEGVSYDNFNGTNAIWAADRSGAVQWYNGGGSTANNTKVKTDTRFSVRPTVSGAYLKGIVTDGNNNLWVVFDGSKNDLIQRYTISRGTVNGVANTPTGLTLVNTITLGDKLGTVTGVTLDPTKGTTGDLWVVAANGPSTPKNGIYAITGGRSLTTNVTVTPKLVGALAATNTQPQGIADPFVPQDDPLTLGGSSSGPDPLIDAPAHPAVQPPSAVLVPPVSTSPSPSLLAPPLGTPPRSWFANAFSGTMSRMPAQGIAGLNLKAINTRTLMAMMTSSNPFPSHPTTF